MNAKRRGTQSSKPRNGPLPTDSHDVVFYRTPDGTMPARDFIESCPTTIRARLRETAIAVAEAPPLAFRGGGKWEAMHGDMTGWFEIRVDGTPNRTHYRLFCLLDYEAQGAERPYLVLVDGRRKPFRTAFSSSEYDKVRSLGQAYYGGQPRAIG